MAHLHTTWPFELLVTVMLVVTAVAYLRRWRSARPSVARGKDGWRVLSFLAGLLVVWIAAASPLAEYDRELLTAHMAQHLLLMTVAAPLLLLGARSLSSTERGRWRWLDRPVACWIAATLTLVGWHIPEALSLGMQSGAWHAMQQTSFLGAGLLFWRPIVRAWPRTSTPASWWTVGYLFLATLPCDVLAAFLIFSERIAYPAYLHVPGHDATTVFADQQRAGALMWTVVTLAYLGVGAVLTTRLLSARTSHEQPTSLASPATVPGHTRHAEVG